MGRTQMMKSSALEAEPKPMRSVLGPSEARRWLGESAASQAVGQGGVARERRAEGESVGSELAHNLIGLLPLGRAPRFIQDLRRGETPRGRRRGGRAGRRHRPHDRAGRVGG